MILLLRLLMKELSNTAGQDQTMSPLRGILLKKTAHHCMEEATVPHIEYASDIID